MPVRALRRLAIGFEFIAVVAFAVALLVPRDEDDFAVGWTSYAPLEDAGPSPALDPALWFGAGAGFAAAGLALFAATVLAQALGRGPS